MINFEKKLIKDYKPKFFNQSEIEKFLKTNEENILIVIRDKKNKRVYETFDSDFSAYLEKLPSSIMKKQVGQIFNRKLVYIGTSKNKEYTIISRVLLSRNEKLAGVVLNSYALDISLSTGSTPQIDEAICATYYGLIRAAIIDSKQEIKKDIEFHKVVTSFIFLLYLKMFGRQLSVSSASQKYLLHLLCVYLYFRQFFEEKHNRVIYLIEKYFVGDLISKDEYEKFSNQVEKFSPYTSFKDIPRALNDLNLTSINQQQLMMLIIKYVDKVGFYSLIGSLDNLIASSIISKYPTELISRSFSANGDVQDKIEKIVDKYINKLSYESVFNFDDADSNNKE